MWFTLHPTPPPIEAKEPCLHSHIWTQGGGGRIRDSYANWRSSYGKHFWFSFSKELYSYLLLLLSLSFYHGVPKCSRRKFCWSFSLKFLNIFVHMSGSIEPITVIWVSLERYFARPWVQIMPIFVKCNNVRSETSEVNKGQRSSRSVTAGTEVNGLILSSMG